MEPISIQRIKETLKNKGLTPQKRLSQNFLVSQGPIVQLIKAADLQKEDTVIEIGPGLGVLTKELAEKAKKVLAIEKDRGLARSLKEELADLRNVEILEGDILKTPIPFKDYKVVSNLPFSITGPVLRKFLGESPRPRILALLIQKEVAQRICAKPPHMSILALSVQFYADSTIHSYVKSGAFWPRPKVDSAIIRIIPKSLSPEEESLASAFFVVMKAGFSQPRKQLQNNLSKKLAMPKGVISTSLKSLDINPARRAETLSLSDWMRVVKWYTMQ
ncbi:MAG: 16S rRNA (adenine(1518)-N(6)/adenine(1519)-N(6))-dimethyltransferase RsmA [bacterium]|nr:16S rRNA (adenine(1518)-N(6)/adenine(1519)-N(6))-dimethyltransferase RsmA [bacterium]